MNGEEFLKYAGEHYKEMKNKWTARLKKRGLIFSEDIFQDTILKVYDHISDYNGDIQSYWYQSFLNNTKRDTKYSCHKRDDTIDVLKYLDDFPNEDRGILLEDIRQGIKNVSEIDFNLFLIYYLTDYTYSEIEELTNVKDVRYKIKGVIKKIRGSIK